MIDDYMSLLPQYLEGVNIRNHAGVIDDENNKLLSMVNCLKFVLRPHRPILFIDDYSFLVDVDDWIQEINITYIDDTTEIIENPRVDGKNTTTTEIVTDKQPKTVTVTLVNKDTYTKHKDETDTTIDTLGKLLLLERLNNETDYEYIQRIQYLTSNIGIIEAGLLYARLIFKDYEITLHSLQQLYNEHPEDWTGKNLDNLWTSYVYRLTRELPQTQITEIGNFIKHFTPCTRNVIFRGITNVYPYTTTPIRSIPLIIGGVNDENEEAIIGLDCIVTCFYHDNTSHDFEIQTSSGRTIPDGSLELPLTNMLLATDRIKILTSQTNFYLPASVEGDVKVEPITNNSSFYHFYEDHLIYPTYNTPVSGSSSTHRIVNNTLRILHGQLWVYYQNLYPLRDSLLIHLYGNNTSFSWFVNEEVILLPESQPSLPVYPSQMKGHWWFVENNYSSGYTDIYYVFKDGIGYKIVDDGQYYVVREKWNTNTLPGNNLYLCHGNLSPYATHNLVVTISRDISNFEEVIADQPVFNAPDTIQVYYGETATITGTLMQRNTGIGGATVQLLKNDTLIRSTTTDNNGAFSIQYPTTIMDYNQPFQLKYTPPTTPPVTKDLSITLKRHTTTVSVPSVSAVQGNTLEVIVEVKDELERDVNRGVINIELEKIENE